MPLPERCAMKAQQHFLEGASIVGREIHGKIDGVERYEA
jgi:hypothetical protein